jgi:hypothetical protein
VLSEMLQVPKGWVMQGVHFAMCVPMPASCVVHAALCTAAEGGSTVAPHGSLRTAASFKAMLLAVTTRLARPEPVVARTTL